MKNPVLILAFNRPEKTEALIQSVVRIYEPERIYFAVDGPRLEKPGDALKVAAVRNLVSMWESGVEFRSLFQDRNLGCAVAVPMAISWFFRSEEQGIIIEDDIEVSAAFFRYMDWSLEHFRNDSRVLHISSFQPVSAAALAAQAEIIVNTHPNVWGWGTWRRAWQYFDPHTVNARRSVMMGWLRNMTSDLRVIYFYWFAARMTRQGKLSSWGYRWLLSIARAGGVCVAPRVSLVRNGGFGDDATHTNREFHAANIVTGCVNWNCRKLVGRADQAVQDEIHLVTNRAHSRLKLFRCWILTCLPNPLFFYLLKRFR